MALDVERISRLEREQTLMLYKQYSEWARHHHTLVWVAASFGVGISLGALTIFEKINLNKLQFTLVGVACLGFLYICHRIAEGNRIQWINHWRFLNAVEAYWGARDFADNQSGPLLGFRPNQRAGGTRTWRIALMCACAATWTCAIILKWTSWFR